MQRKSGTAKKYNSYSGSIPLTVFGNKFCLKKRKEIHREPDTSIKMRSFILYFSSTV